MEIDQRILRGLRIYRRACSDFNDELDQDPAMLEKTLIEGWKKEKTFESDAWQNAKLEDEVYRLQGINNRKQMQADGMSLAWNAARLLEKTGFNDRRTLLNQAVAFAVLGSANTRSQRLCKYCNRYAEYKHQTCRDHFQNHVPGKAENGYPINADLKNRLAGKVADADFEGGLLTELSTINMGEIIFPLTFARDEDRHYVLHKPLHPRVVELIGSAEELAKCSHPDFLSRMRRYDRLDFSQNTTHWLLKIWKASAQAYAEDAILAARKPHGQRGKGKRTITAVDQAIALAKAGKTASEIAAELDVGKSAVSNWKKRYPEFDLALRAGNGRSAK